MEDLTEGQQLAAQRACEILGAIASEKWEPGPARRGPFDFLPRLDEKRENHVLLIGGGRGSGKTALLVTLLDMWSRAVRGDLQPGHVGGHDKWRSLLQQTSAVIPIGMVDLQPLPPSTDLLTHLVGQLLRAIEAIEDRVQPANLHRTVAPWEASVSEATAPRTAWRHFLMAAALGSKAGAMSGRRAQLDAEAFAVEHEQAEQNRLDTVRAFRLLVDALVVSFREQRISRAMSPGEYPLFVLPVDDADMSPERTTELMDLLRTLWHPRVAFVVTGQVELIHARLRAQFRPQLFLHSESPHDSSRRALLARVEDDLVDQTCRKVIPLAHRLTLPPLTTAERFEKLRGCLKLIRGPRDTIRLQSMAEYFEVLDSFKLWLPENLRKIADLEQWVTLRRQKGSEVSTIEPAELYGLLTEGTYDDPFGAELDPAAHQQRVAQLVSALAGRQFSWADRPSSIARTQPTADIEGTIVLAKSMRLRASSSAGEEGTPVPISTLAGFDILPGPLSPVVPNWPSPIQAQIRSPSTAWVLRDWPVPRWRRTLDVAALFVALREVTANDGKPLELDALARRFVDTVLELVSLRVQRREPASTESLSDGLAALHKVVISRDRTWRDLAIAIVALASSKGREEDDELIRDWALGDAICLAAPESGLPVSAANEWLRELRTEFRDRWDLVRQLASARSRFLPKLSAESSGKDWGPELTAWRDGYDWVSEIEEGDRKLFWWDALTKKLGSIQGPPVVGSNQSIWSAYILGTHREEVLRTLPSSTMDAWVRLLGEMEIDSSTMRRGFVPLWRRVLESGVAPDLPEPPEELTIESMSSMYDSLRGATPPWRFVEKHSSTRIKPSLVFRQGAFQWSDDTRLSSPLGRVVFEIAWDLTVDMADIGLEAADLPDERHLRWWFGVGGRWDTSEICPWPAVSWWSFVDHHLLARAWNRRCTWLFKVAEEVRGAESLGEEIAWWYIRAVDQILMNRSIAESSLWMNSPREENWQSLMNTLRQRGQSIDRGRYRCFEKWLMRLPLIAAPESGLGVGAAGAILGTFRLSGAGRGALRKARESRFVEALGYTKEQASTAIRKLNDEFPDHPWTLMIEKEQSSNAPSGS